MIDPSLAIEPRVLISVVVLDAKGSTLERSGRYSVQEATTMLCRHIIGDRRVVGWGIAVSGPKEPRYV